MTRLRWEKVLELLVLGQAPASFWYVDKVLVGSWEEVTEYPRIQPNHLVGQFRRLVPIYASIRRS